MIISCERQYILEGHFLQMQLPHAAGHGGSDQGPMPGCVATRYFKR